MSNDQIRPHPYAAMGFTSLQNRPSFRELEQRFANYCCKNAPTSFLILLVVYILLSHISHAAGFLLRSHVMASEASPFWLPAGYSVILPRRVGNVGYFVTFFGELLGGFPHPFPPGQSSVEVTD